MGLYRLQENYNYNYDQYSPEGICEQCLNVYIESGDSYLAEQFLDEQQFIALNEENTDAELGKLLHGWNDLTKEQKVGFAKKMSKELQDEVKAMNKKEQEFKDKHPTLYKIKGKGKEYYSKVIEFFKRQKDWFVDKLQKINKWADSCKDNKEKTIFSRIIAFIVRMIRKITDKIEKITNKW